MLARLAWTYSSSARKTQRIVRPARGQFVVGVILLAFAASLAMNASSSACEKQEPACDHSSGLFKEDKKEIARQLVSAAEYTTLVWKGTYSSIAYNVELDEAENRGYTAGIIGFTSKYSDLLAVVQCFSENKKENLLNKYKKPLKDLSKRESGSKDGLGKEFEEAWKKSDQDDTKLFREAQDFVNDTWYFEPAVCRAQRDGLKSLGQFIYYDAIVMHGPDPDLKEKISFDKIRDEAIKKTKTPANCGDETEYLNIFMSVRVELMKREAGHKCNIDRVQNMQQKFLDAKNLDLNPPLSFTVNKTAFKIPPN